MLGASPWLFTFLLQYAGGASSAEAEEVMSLFHQECLYGLALVAILASNAFGTELRSRRAIFLLSRAVSRDQYLAALWLSAFRPGILYILSTLRSGLIAIPHMPIHLESLLYVLLTLLFINDMGQCARRLRFADSGGLHGRGRGERGCFGDALLERRRCLSEARLLVRHILDGPHAGFKGATSTYIASAGALLQIAS